MSGIGSGRELELRINTVFDTLEVRVTSELVSTLDTSYGCFQKIGIPQNGWFIMENPI